MPRGGYRPGAGRKKGTKDSQPRKKEIKKIEDTASTLVKNTKSLFDVLGTYLGTKSQNFYKNLTITPDNAFDSMRMLRDDLQVRYNLARIGEMESLKVKKKIAQLELDELDDKGTIDGKVVKKAEVPKIRMRLKGYIDSKFPYMDPNVTALADQLRQINDRLHMIESGDSNKNVNIFNIFSGKHNEEKIEKVTEALFNLPIEEGTNE